MSNKGCGTCRARKVLCDRAVPVCRRCTQAGRTCMGYGLNLSWPREGDGKRAIQGPEPSHGNDSHGSSHNQLINVFPWDIEMQYNVSEPGANSIEVASRARLPDRANTGGEHEKGMGPYNQIPAGLPLAYAHVNLTVHEKELVQYFVSVTSFTLKAFGQNATNVRDVVLRMALSDSTLSSTAVLRSAIALASIHRDGAQSDAVRFKLSALRALSDTSKGGIDEPKSFQHVAAGMLLCSYEVQASSATSSHWLWYVCGSKSLIKTTKLDETTAASDFASLIGWVQYFDVLARFSLRHWKRHRNGEDSDIQPLGFSDIHPTVCGDGQGGRLKSSSHEVLSLLSEVCDGVLEPSNPEYHTDDYKNYIKVLEWKLRNIKILGFESDADIEPALLESSRILELFRLSTLIYLVRSSEGLIKEPKKVCSWIDSAFDILSQIDTCKNPFPLLILGCEADTDERRTTLLNLLSRTEKTTYKGDLEFVTAIIQAIWAQQDLENEELDYAHKLHVIFSSSGIVPALV